MKSNAAEEMPPPHVIGRYALFEEIAFGGMATVHLGRLAGTAGFSRTVAIKRLHPQFARDPEFVTMFLDEARLASRAQHPNVVATLDVVADVNEVYLVMEYVRGEALSKLWRNSNEFGRQIPADIATSIICDLLNGLHAAHEAKSETGEPLGIVHRDVSPQNVLVGRDGIARVLDFGVAKAAQRAQSTREGQVKGKLGYMSPEQLNAKAVDRRADIFAAGVIAWETLVGQRLFVGDDAGEIIGKLLSGTIEAPNDVLLRLGKQKISQDVNDAVLKALERDPDQRYPTARDFAIALEAAIVVAPPHKVGEWVQDLAGPELDARMRKVEQIERYAFAIQSELTPNPISVGGMPQVRVADEATQQDVRKAALAPIESQPPEFRPNQRRKLAVAGGLATLLLFAFLLFAGDGDEAERKLRGEGIKPPASEGPAATAANSPMAPSAQPPVPSAQPPESNAEPLASAAPGPSAASTPTASAKPPPPSVSHTVSPRAPTRGKPKSSCTPPWRIDERGIKRLKPGCF
jgi:serine/threonine-protein kinase